MDFVPTKKTILILSITLIVAVSIPVSVYLFKKGYFDIRNEASEGDSANNPIEGENKAIIDENLVAQWNFNEESGTVLSDSTSNGNDGTLNGFDETNTQDQSEFSGWTADNAKFEGALSFDGEDDYISVSDDSSLRSEKITLSAWFKTNEDGYLVGKHQESESGYALIIDNDVVSCWVGGKVWVSGSTEVTDDQWHNGVCTYDGNSVKVFVDGVVDASKSQEADLNSFDSLTIGSFDLGTSQFFDGVIDCIQIYDVALSVANVQEKMSLDDFENAIVDINEEEQDEEKTADIDKDGKIGVNDYYLFVGDYNEYQSEGSSSARSDLDNDSDIDMDDYSLFFNEYEGRQ